MRRQPTIVKGGQAGTTIVDALIAIGMVSVAFYFGTRIFSTHMEMQSRLGNAEQYNEFEHVLRHGTAKFTQALQSRLIAEGGCKQGGAIFNAAAGELAGGLLKFGAAPTRKNMAAALGGNLEDRLNRVYVNAIDRCASSTLAKTGGSLAGLSTIYFCATLSSAPRDSGLLAEAKRNRTLAFAEFRLNLVDFNRNVPLKCEDLTAIPGRGSIVQYTLYMVEASKKPDVKPTARRHSGRLYVPRE